MSIETQVYELNLDDGETDISYGFLCIASSVWHRASGYALAEMPHGRALNGCQEFSQMRVISRDVKLQNNTYSWHMIYYAMMLLF